jgi:hypothetical protein
MAGIPEKDATRAAAGWGGDRAFLFERSEGSLFVWKTVWDKAADAEEFFRAYNDMQKRRAGTQSAGTQGDGAQTLWRESGRLVIVRREGDAVIIVRAAEADAPQALELARR